MSIKGNSVGNPFPNPQNGLSMRGAIEMNGQPISGLNMPTANDQAANMGFVNQQVKKAAPHNLLDNSDFTNPVNQRGQTSYTSDGYCFDRWVIWHNNGCNVSYDSEKRCVRVSSIGNTTLYQRLPKGVLDQTKKYTHAYGLTEGRVVISTRIDYSPANYDSVEGITLSDGQTLEIVWTALYEGEYTAETLPEYQPKGYGVELAECQRYFIMLGTSGGTVGIAHAYDAENAYAFVPTPTPMRVNPSITFQKMTIGTAAYSASFAMVTEVSNPSIQENGVKFWPKASGLTPGNLYALDATNLALSADL